MDNATARLASFVADATFDDLPPPVVHESKRLLLDTIGCALGAIDTESGRIAIDYAAALGGRPDATVLGARDKSSPVNAAYANARLANVLDADDTFPTGTHFANATIFAALALAEQQRSTGRALLTAIAVGFDVGARIGSAMGSPIRIENGKVVGYADLGGPSATMTWAGVAAAAKIAGLDKGRVAHAFGIAGANTPLPSLRKWAEQIELPMYKYADSGWCAHTGVAATLLASLGSTGFAAILDGDFGFWRLFGAKSCDYQALTGDLGTEWRILNTTYKPWPSCRWTHYPLTAFLSLKREHDLKADEIERLIVRANPFALSARFKAQQPDAMIKAEFSHAHIMAMGALDVPPGPSWYSDDTLNAAPVREFRARVTVEPEPRAANLAEWMEGGQFRRLPGGVDIHARGRILSETVDMAYGDPWSNATLFSDDALKRKFDGMVAGTGIDAGRVAHIIDRIEDIDDVRDLTRSLVAAI
jgi:2-methylcitrate dehydratase PrpD